MHNVVSVKVKLHKADAQTKQINERALIYDWVFLSIFHIELAEGQPKIVDDYAPLGIVQI